MNGPRTDLAMERADFAGESLPAGVTRSKEICGEIEVDRIKITGSDAAAAMEKPEGSYVTLSLPSLSYGTQSPQQAAECLANEVSRLLPKEGSVLVIGLGNRAITPDALGPLTADQIFPTRHIPQKLASALSLGSLRTVSVIQTGVTGKTGVETAELSSAVCETVKPAAVIAIDALAAGDPNRLGCTIQLADSGISPGSGVQNARKELSAARLGVPVIAVGIPTVVDAAALCQTDSAAGMMVTPREIDAMVRHGSQLLALGINLALQPDLSADDILGLTAE